MKQMQPTHLGLAARFGRRSMAVLTGTLLALAGPAYAAQFVINGPSGSGEFGRSVTVLPNGNIVVTDPGFDGPGPVADVGAVRLYRPNGSLISTLRGGSANDRVGGGTGGGVVVLANGNFVVISPDWDAGAVVNVGAVTFVSGSTGLNGVLSAANSLVGSTANDRVGNRGVTALPSGNYVVLSTTWDNGPVNSAGAATFGSGTTGVVGVVSPANSLVGSSGTDQIGQSGVTVLANGNYVIGSPSWEDGPFSEVGAATFASGTTGVTGVVSAANSLVGSTDGDRVGETVVALANGNYLVVSRDWDNGPIVDAGAVTFASGTTGRTGLVTAANSLAGSTANDGVGSIARLTNGNYVIVSEDWDHGSVVDAGAVTFASGTTGISGTISAANSLVGSTANDAFGLFVTPLSNGNYVVRNSRWDRGAIVDAGAATFGSGVTGVSGLITTANSLVGSTANDRVGDFLVGLSNGNYVVASPGWDNGAIADVGAVTFASGATGISGTVSSANSLVGGSADDRVGSRFVQPLANGNYVVASPFWDNGTIVDAGAATFASGTTGRTGLVSAANSLVGGTAGDQIGVFGATALSNGNYVVGSPNWDNGALANVGAATFGSGTTGITGLVSLANSLVGGTAGDQIGNSGVAALDNGSFLVLSRFWDNGAIVDAGALTFGSGTSSIVGVVSPANSLVGSSANDLQDLGFIRRFANGNFVVPMPRWDNGAGVDAGAITLGLGNGSVTGPLTSAHSVLGLVANQGATQVFAYDPQRNQLVVGQPASNRVVLHRTGIATTLGSISDQPDPSIVGQPVTLSVRLTASPITPSDGQVTFTASSGQSCVDPSPTPVSATEVSYSCTIVFTTPGLSSVVAEYTGSIIHAYSGSDPFLHTTLAQLVFANGFESP